MLDYCLYFATLVALRSWRSEGLFGRSRLAGDVVSGRMGLFVVSDFNLEGDCDDAFEDFEGSCDTLKEEVGGEGTECFCAI